MIKQERKITNEK